MKHSSVRTGAALGGALLLIVLIVALPAASRAQVRSQTPQKSAPRGAFDLRLLATLEPEQVYHPRSGPDGKMRPAAPATTVARGNTVTVVLFLKDCQPDSGGNCNVEVDLQGFLPNGQPFENKKSADLWRSKKAPPAGIAQLGNSKMTIKLEASDPTGVYRIVAVAHDRIGGTDKRAETTFEVK